MDGYGEVYLPYATLQSVKIKSVKFFLIAMVIKFRKSLKIYTFLKIVLLKVSFLKLSKR